MASGIAGAARALRRGQLVVYPTDTLWGLGAQASNAGAVRRLERAKGRPSGQPLSVAVSSVEEVERWARLTPSSRAWIRRHLPGAFTVLLEPSPAARRTLPASVVSAGGHLGLRVPDHPVARELAREGGPVVATSANRHGEAPARGLTEARRAFGRTVAVYLPGSPAPSGRPSLLVDLTGPRPRSVRRS